MPRQGLLRFRAGIPAPVLTAFSIGAPELSLLHPVPQRADGDHCAARTTAHQARTLATLRKSAPAAYDAILTPISSESGRQAQCTRAGWFPLCDASHS